jgi:hypothetical protein
VLNELELELTLDSEVDEVKKNVEELLESDNDEELLLLLELEVSDCSVELVKLSSEEESEDD